MTPEQMLDEQLRMARNELAHWTGRVEGLANLKMWIDRERAEQEKKLAAQHKGPGTPEITNDFFDALMNADIKDIKESIDKKALWADWQAVIDKAELPTRPKRRRPSKRVAKSVKRK